MSPPTLKLALLDRTRPQHSWISASPKLSQSDRWPSTSKLLCSITSKRFTVSTSFHRLPPAATKSQWGCHCMIFSGHLPCTQQWSARLIVFILCFKIIKVNVVPIRSMACFPSFAGLHHFITAKIILYPLICPSTNFNTNLTIPAYDTFSQQDATVTDT